MTERINMEQEREKKEQMERLLLVTGLRQPSLRDTYDRPNAVEQCTDAFMGLITAVVNMAEVYGEIVNDWIRRNPLSVILIGLLLVSIVGHLATAMSVKHTIDTGCNQWMDGTLIANAERKHWKTLNVTLVEKMSDMTAYMQGVDDRVASLKGDMIVMIWLIAGVMCVGGFNIAYIIVMHAYILEKKIEGAKSK